MDQQRFRYLQKAATMPLGLSKVEYVALPAEGRYFDNNKNRGCIRLAVAVVLWLFLFGAVFYVALEIGKCELQHDCEFTSTAIMDKWNASDSRNLHNVSVRSDSNLTKAHVLTRSIPSGQHEKYRENCGAMIYHPTDGGCKAPPDQRNVSHDMLNKSWRDGGCSLFRDAWQGEWCTRFDAKMHGSFGDANFTFTSVELYWHPRATSEQIQQEEPGVELSWAIPLTVDGPDADVEGGFQSLYYGFNADIAQKTEMYFMLHETETYLPVAYFLWNMGFGLKSLRPPNKTYELVLDQQFSRPAVPKHKHGERFAAAFYLRSSTMKRVVMRRPILRIGTIPSYVGGFAKFLMGLGTIAFLGLGRQPEVCLKEGSYNRMRVADTAQDEIQVQENDEQRAVNESCAAPLE